MTPVAVGYIAIFILILLIFSRMHIGIAMGLVGFFGFAYILGIGKALSLLKTVPYTTFASKDMSVIPLFILMGSFGFAAGMSEDLYRAIHKFLGHLKGGLAMATVVACACFAAISGSSLATAATLGRVAMPEMKKYNYHASLATGAIAAGGSIGILIPPSVILIIYGIITEQSIAELFLAGFIPGILEAFFYIIAIALLTRINPSLGPVAPKCTFREKMSSLTSVWEVVVLFIVVIGGIYSGIFTPTEAAGVGAFGTLCFALMRRKMTWKSFKLSLSGTINTTGMLFLIVLGAMILGYFFSVSRLPFQLATFVSGLPVSRYVILILILIVVMLLGCIMDSLAIVLLTIPVFYPIILELGFHPVWFGIIVVRVTEMGLITPPVGLNVYIIQGISGERMETVFRGVIPFIIADICEIVLLIMIPQLSLFLPALLSG
jgi:tripartite ATP-independent transporter DctM subunit